MYHQSPEIRQIIFILENALTHSGRYATNPIRCLRNDGRNHNLRFESCGHCEAEVRDFRRFNWVVQEQLEAVAAG